MKRVVPSFALLLALFAFPAFALDTDTRQQRRDDRRESRRHIVDDVIRMSQSGIDNSTIISFVRRSRDRFEITADDIIEMKDAGVSNEVIKEVIAEAESRRDDRSSSPRVYTGVFVDPWFWGGWGGPLWDPWWYGPRLSVGVRLGGGYGGYYRGHHFRDHRYPGRRRH
ncbi:MAG TPA: hypothetical protein VFL80_10120 [Thermoanaerobaculia bacterium]|nr:hypothetical protein [Thermoanaerobaculia bacterium]